MLDRDTLTAPGLAVIVSGTTSMGLEIVGGRMLAPDFGSSVYTWGSILGVFMAALSLGYWLGGRRAEDHASTDAIAHIMLASAAYVGVVLAAGDQLVNMTAALPLPARFISLPAVVLLFGPPVFLLGMITPYAAQLSRKETHGAASGQVFALGTVGSIAGAFLTTFWLIPSFPLASIEFGFGMVLVTAAAVISRRPALPIGLAVILVLAGGIGTMDQVAIQGETVYSTQTPYQRLTVADDGGVRTLYLNGWPQSATYLDGRDGYVFEYVDYLHVPFLLQDDIDDVLVIGGGGFSAPTRYVDLYNVTVDVVELDPGVVTAAKAYFNVSESERLRIHVMDGRRFLTQTDTEYDLIVMDAYRKDKVPFHLTTKEFMQLAQQRLDGDGMLMINLIAARDGPQSRLYTAVAKTMETAFPTVVSFPTRDTGGMQNIELLGTQSAEPPTQEQLQQLNREKDIGLDLSDEITQLQTGIDTSSGIVLRDSHAPVNALVTPGLQQTQE